MGRWIAFDEESTAIAAAESGMAVAFQRGDALKTALVSSKPAIVLLPGATSEEILIVEFTPGHKFRASPPRGHDSGSRGSDQQPVAYEATGFLGLSDEPVFNDEPAAKKKWWKRLLD